MRLVDEATRKARAAWAYSGLDQDELAERAGIKPATLANYLLSTRGGPGLEQLLKIAEATGVPDAFMRHGFAAIKDLDEPSLEERVEALERQLQALTRRAAAAAPPDLVPPAETQHLSAGAPSSGTSGQQSARSPAEGSS